MDHQLPKHMIFKHGVSKATQLRIYAYLRTLGTPHGGYWFERDDEIAKFLKISRQTLVRSYKWLVSQKYLECAGCWPNSKQRRYKLASLKRHDDKELNRGGRTWITDEQIKDNDTFVLVFFSVDIQRQLRAAAKRDSTTLKTKEVLACRRGFTKGTSTIVRLPYAYFCNRYRVGAKRFKRIQKLGNALRLFISESKKRLVEGLSIVDWPYIGDYKTEDGYLYIGRDGLIYERLTTSYSRYIPTNKDIPCLVGG
jgi:hypothetical protein